MADQHQLYTILHSIYADCVHTGVEDQSDFQKFHIFSLVFTFDQNINTNKKK